MRIQVPIILKVFAKSIVWRQNPNEKNIYVTFDDGPIPEITPKVLGILDQYDVKATFFCVGDNVRKHPETYNQVLQKGHRVGNHTFNHIKGYNFTTAEYYENVQKASEYINSNLFRPPHGQITPWQIKKISPHYKIIMWDFLTFDYDKSITSEKIMKIIRKKTKNGSIVIFHDSLKAEKNILETLPQALKFWKDKGYKFNVIE